MKPNLPPARLIFSDGRVSTFHDQTVAYLIWLSLPAETRVAFRGKGDNRPVMPWDFVDKPQ